MNRFLFLLFVLFCFTQVSAQQKSIFEFIADDKQIGGFDAPSNVENEVQFPRFRLPSGKRIAVAQKSIPTGKSDRVQVIYHSSERKTNWEHVRFLIDSIPLRFTVVNDTLCTVFLPVKKKGYAVFATENEVRLNKLNVRFFDDKQLKLVLVPLVKKNYDWEKVENAFKPMLQPLNMKLELDVAPVFQSKLFNTTSLFSAPDTLIDAYTGQMRLLRDVYFEANPSADKNAFYLFIIPGFSDSSKLGFMVQGKSIGFVPKQKNETDLAIQSMRSLGFGLAMLEASWKLDGPAIGTTKNLMDTTFGTALNFKQWDAFRSDLISYSRIDAYENVKTNNGTIAYYFWEENKNGTLKLEGDDLFKSIHRPYRKNYLAYRFHVKYSWMMPFYRIGKFYISSLNLIFVALILGTLFWFRRRLKRFWETRQYHFKFLRRLVFWIFFAAVGFVIYESLHLSNWMLDRLTVISGPLPELEDVSTKEATKQLVTDSRFRKQPGNQLHAEILIHKNKKWEIKKRMPVLYFEVKEKNGKKEVRFLANSDSLLISSLTYAQKTNNHYVVLNYTDEDGTITAQTVHDYAGKDLTNSFQKEDIPKRILVFVNGYRPTSVGKTLEDNFRDIRKNGLENRNSTNHIYDFDRYDYWEPWNQFNRLMISRINPSETYYADGHFSVSTSNFRSILNFTRISQTYPKRCSNPKKHTCYYSKSTGIVPMKSKTENQLKKRSNRSGFNQRKEKGRIAGLNLLQITNEIPGFSKNDTLYVVAHSMGFAYSLGMIEVLRGKINFGGFYILAPENAKAGKVNPAEWQTIWQYGSRFHLQHSDAPCLQDGVAPQSGVRGLPMENRVFIPEKLYTKKGFFDSHFIGYYTWILNLESQEKGYVSPR